MKSLLDLQREVRELEKNVSTIVRDLHNINSDIDVMRNTDSNEDFDYDTIKFLANQIPFRKHPISNLQSEIVRRLYLQILLNIVCLDQNESRMNERLILIEWIRKESKIDLSLEDIYKDTCKMEKESFFDFVALTRIKYRECLIVDALVVAGVKGTANAEIYEYIAGLVEIFNIEKFRLRILAIIAKTALSQKVERMSMKEWDDFREISVSFKHYIGKDVEDIGIRDLRQIVIKLADTDVKNFKWKVKQLQEVKEGEVLATYSEQKRTKGSFFNWVEEPIISPADGTIFQFRDNCINYGVLGHKTDNKDSIKLWVKGGMHK